jgi:hypothetical protein
VSASNQVPLLRKAPAPDMWCVNCEAGYLGGRRIPQGRSGSGATSSDEPQQHTQTNAWRGGDGPVHSDGTSDAEDPGDVDPTADPRL